MALGSALPNVNSDLGLGSDKITAGHNLTNQRQNISQNVPENFDSDLKNLKILRVENDLILLLPI